MKISLNKIKIKQILILILLFFTLIITSAYTYANSISYDLANNVFRLHVIANSDSDEDQSLKYKVRDKVLEYMNSLVDLSASKEEIVAIAKEHSADFKKIAEDVISENGYTYPVTISINNFYFPTKQYGDISFPSRLL